VGSLKSGIRKLKEKLSANYVTLVLEDGTSERFLEADFTANFSTNMERLRDVYHGNAVSTPHPLGQALVRALPECLDPELRREAERQKSIDELVEAKEGRVGPVAS
jgi:hypothetical protein